MKKLIIDINVDVGEGVNNEAELMPYMSSCNIACGGHAGDETTMRRIVKLAISNNVKIGAHPAFPDKDNFGRKTMHISHADLYTSVKKQIRTLLKVLRDEHAVLQHMKPHGALYNLAMIDKNIAGVIIEVVKSIAMPIKLFVPYNSVIANLAMQEHIPIVYEAFADRNYNSDLTLVSRNEKNAIITDADELFDHVSRIFFHNKVKSIKGKDIEIKANTFCIHGDNPNAVKLIQELNKKMNVLIS